VLATPAGAIEPDSVSFTLEGCRANIVPQPNQVCADTYYTTGNLDSTGQGPSWNEFDLVPHRLTTKAGTSAPAIQTYDVGVAVDYQGAGKTGYDALSIPVLNVAKSSTGCVLVAVTGGTAGTQTPGNTGDASLTRTLTVTQLRGSTCVFDYYARLAIGAHEFPGSSLHSNLLDGGNKEVSIPVNRIEPQALNKDMSASLNSNHTWSVAKGATPTSLTFSDTCSAPTGSSAPVSITVTWTKGAGNATGFHVVTHVYATNPANRLITVSVTDKIYTDSTLLGTNTFPSVDVPAGTANFEVGTWGLDVATSAVANVNAPNFNDVATGTYTDNLTGVAVPGTTETTASVANDAIGVGSESNTSATIVDTENITGDGFTFSVASPSSGSFDGYTAGEKVTGPVVWRSDAVTASGSVTFSKSVYLDTPRVSSGELSGTAVLTGSGGSATAASSQASGSIDIDATSLVSLRIDKTIPNVLQGQDTETFTFAIWAKGSNTTTGTPVRTASITLTAGETTKSTTVSGLAPDIDIYFVTENPATGWNLQPPSGEVDLSVQSDGSLTCSGSVRFANDFGRATAKVVKVTVPATHEGGWTMCLQGPGTENLPNGKECVVTATNGEAPLTTVLQEGAYTVTETQQPGWRQSASSGCSFTVDYPADKNRLFTCTLSNEELGRIIVKKLTDPPNQTQPFAFTLVGGPSALNQSFSLTHGQTHDSDYVQAGADYRAAETVPPGWDQSLASCDDGSPVGNINVAPGETVTCTFTNKQRGQIVIKKATDPPLSTQPFAFTLGGGPSALSQAFPLTGGGTHESGFVKPGSGYAAAETVPTGWEQTSAVCSDGSPVDDIDVAPAEIVTCTFTNTAKPNGITLDKQVNGGDHATIGDALLAHALDPLTYTIVITNNGQVPLTITALTDSLYPGLVAACPQGVASVLAPGASFTCTYQVSAAGDAQNVAAVAAVDSINRAVSDSDETFVDVIHPLVLIDKTANPTSVDVSGSVTYTYVVTNTGDTVLHDVVVTDDILGEIGTVGTLAPGESKTLTKTVVVDAKTPRTNIGTVTGIDVLGKTVTDTDDATITVVPALVLAEVLPLTVTPPGVVAPPVPPVTAPLAAAELPRTGSPLATEARLGIILLQAGLALELLGRRRRRLHLRLADVQPD
jgi:uncharacterized repeat protein (TIGR01451 family)